eukprot:791903-Amphidinium_carterae.1
MGSSGAASLLDMVPSMKATEEETEEGAEQEQSQMMSSSSKKVRLSGSTCLQTHQRHTESLEQLKKKLARATSAASEVEAEASNPPDSIKTLLSAQLKIVERKEAIDHIMRDTADGFQVLRSVAITYLNPVLASSK